MGMSDNFLAELDAEKNPSVVPVADLYFLSGAGGTHSVSSEPFQHYRQEVAEGGFGNVKSAVAARPSDLGPQSLSLTLLDRDFYYTKLLKGRYKARRSRVLCRMAHPDLAEEDWYTFFDGVLDSWESANGTVTLSCRTDDSALRGYIPKVQVLKGAFPGAPDTSLGIYIPIILGIHDAQGLTSQGMIPTVCISQDATLGYKYAVTLGTAASVPRVYKNGSLQTVTTHYTVAQESFGGATITIISMVSSTTASDEITCDVEGLTDDGTTSGAVILDPVDQLKWICNNLIWNDWRGGSYYTDAPVDATAFAVAQSYTSAFGYEGARRYGGTTDQTRGLDAVNGWLRSHPMLRLRWTFDGSLAPVVLDHRFAGYSDDNWIDGDRDEIAASFRYALQASGLVSKVSFQYLYGEADSKFWQSLEIQDLARWEEEKAGVSFDLSHSASRFQ
jgi:hypothetical protein